MNDERQLPAIPDNLAGLMELGRVLCKSGLLPRELNTPEKAVAALVVARDLGLGASAVLQGDLYVVGGRVSLQTRCMLGMILKSGVVDITIDVSEDRQTVSVTMERRDNPLRYTSVWDEARVTASRANISPKTGKEKPTWTHYRHYMLIHRAVSEAAQMTCPDIIGHTYVPGELNVIEAEPTRVFPNGAALSYSDFMEPEPEPAKEHWIANVRERSAFWSHASRKLGLTSDQVHTALGVKSMYDYHGTRYEAIDALWDYIDDQAARAEDTELDIPEQEGDNGEDDESATQETD